VACTLASRALVCFLLSGGAALARIVCRIFVRGL